ncbi:MAG: hypothetical protein NTY70_06400, partial [Burkholderiales bacterium]|nr:hypothetical protein [Burkholderiales bacterium]
LLRFAFFLCLLCSALPSLAADKELANAQNTQQKVKEASLSIFNRDIIVFRASVLGIEPVDRVTRAQKRIEQQISPNGRHKVTALSMPPGMLIQIDGAGSFYIAPDDIDQFQQETLEGVAKDVVTKLSAVVLETQESRSVENMLRAAGYVLVASIVFIVLVWGVQRLRRLIEARILSFASAKLDGLDLVHAKLINRERTLWILHRLFQLLLWVIVFLLTYQWLSLVMSQFPFTRPWGEHLNSFLFNLVANIGSAILKAIPDVFTALVIFFLAKLVNHEDQRAVSPALRFGCLHWLWLTRIYPVPAPRLSKGSPFWLA